MKLLIIALFAITTPFLVSVEATMECWEWCEAKSFKSAKGLTESKRKEICVKKCEERVTGCLKVCGDFLDENDRSTCKENCRCVDKAAKILDLLKTNRQEVVKQFSQNSDSCDDSE